MRKYSYLAILTGVALTVTSWNLSAQPGPAADNPAAAGQQRRGGFGGFGGGPTAPPGPPAPIPPEVAMPRPTAAEVEQINAALKQFIATSRDKELLTKYQSLLTVQVPRENSCIRPAQSRVRSTQRHNGFVDIAKTNDFDILFVGDSITDWWQQGGEQGGAAVQAKYFGDVKVANFAVAGDTTQGVLWGLQNGEGQGHKPKAVMVMIGTNNTGGNTGPEIAEGVGAIILQLRKDFPDAKILLLAIFPRGSGPDDSNRKKNDEANEIIAKLNDGKHVFFMSLNDKFLNDQGGLIGFRRDNLHPNAEGYEIWAKAVAPTLNSWVK